MPIESTPNCTAVDRAFEILELLDGAQRGWSISEVSRRLLMPKSTAHVLMRTLERRGYLTRDARSRAYSLGLKVYGLGRGIIKNLTLPDLSMPPVRALVETVRLTAHLAVLEGDQAIYILKVDGPGLIRFDTYVGKRTNLHCTAIGKVLLAHARPDFVRETLSRTTFTRHTEHTLTTAAAIRPEIHKVRQNGYAFDDQEEELEVRCLAVPVLEETGACVAALGVCGTTGQIRPENTKFFVAAMQKAANGIAAELRRSACLSAPCA
jgi:DNA-binding IclR family transcriptional regulator